MSNLSTTGTLIQTESLQYQAPVSESSMQAMGGAINYCLLKLIPIGTIIPSMLTQAQFNGQVGSGYWVIADGSSCTGTAYASVTGYVTVPDLRGVFLRGKNNGRSDGNQNPDGDLTLGTYQADAFASHTHSYPADGDNGLQNNNHASNGNGTGGTNSNTVASAGGNETRAKNVTVNYFIRVN
jgi:hypothetical protein